MANEAFVVCQVGAEGSEIRKRADEVCDYIVKPVVDEVGLEMGRSDRDPTPGQVTSQIVRKLTSAQVIIADLTGKNPNVYYELAVAHAFRRPVVILVDDPKDLSFDTSTERVIPLGKAEVLGVAQVDQAKKKLAEALKVVLAEGYEPQSLVTEAAGSQSLSELAPDNPIATELALVRERVEILLTRTPARAEARWERDAKKLWEFIREQSDLGAFSADELDDVAHEVQSGPLRRVLAKRADALREAEPDSSGQEDDEIPF